MSIFTKSCPRCAADNAAEAERCVCGYVFDGNVTSDSYAAIELALQEAELYSEYLKARLQQTHEAAEVAAADAQRSPGDADKARRAEETRAEYKLTKTEYKIQKDQIADLQSEADARKKREIAAARKSAWEMARRKAADRAAASAQAKSTKKMAGPEAKDAKPVRPPVTMQQKLARKAQQAIARVREMKSATQAAAPAPVLPQVTPTKQAAAARPVTKPVTKPANKPVAKTAPTPPKRVVPAEAKKPRPNTIECPHCTSVLPIGAQRCRCGFTFKKTTDTMPGIGLTSEEQAQLLSLFQPDKS